MTASDPCDGSDPGSDLLAWNHASLERLFTGAGISPAHVDTVWADLHRRLAPTLAELTCTPPRVAAFLQSRGLTVGTPDVVRETASTDGHTRKILLRFGDGVAVETVLMRFRGRVTACLSTQAGCAMGCVFCATGHGGLVRHLRAGEIVAQAYHVARILRSSGERLRNVVLMGQGEPLHNYEATMRAVDTLLDPHGQAIAGTRVTLSTVGVVPGILRMADERRRIALAVSLHAATDDERVALVPVARRWPLAELMAACQRYTESTGNKVFFEWTLIDGQTDGEARALRLARLLEGQRAQVNLIPLNPTEGYDGAPTDPGRARVFARILQEHGIPTTLRQRRGIDIAAGCGQLATIDSRREAANHAPV